MRNTIGLSGVTAVAAFALFAPLAGQTEGPVQHVIEFRLNLESHDQSVGGRVVDGGRFAVTLHGQGSYAISAVVTNPAAGAVSVSVLRASEEGAEDFRVIETREAVQGRPTPLRSLPQAAIVIDRIRPVTASLGQQSSIALASHAPGNVPAAAFSNECCLSCGGVTACGCAIQWPGCGNCCVKPCCDDVIVPSSSLRSTPAETFMQMAGLSCAAPVPASERLFTAGAVARHSSR